MHTNDLVILREQALIADGERGAVIGPRGEIEWLCVPRFDSEPVFSTLLGGLGHYTIAPTDPWNIWEGAYEPGSLIWHGTWVDSDAEIDCINALAYPAKHDTVVILRKVRAVSNTARLSVSLRLASGFDQQALTDLQMKDGVWQGNLNDLKMRWQGAPEAKVGHEGELVFDLELPEGQERLFVLEIGRGNLPTVAADGENLLEETRIAWQRVVSSLPRPGNSDDIRQSYAVLAGLTSHTHGMVAAATMSLPEHEKGYRNYDYRYVWIRDQCYTGQALAALGDNPLFESALTFVTQRVLEDGSQLKPAYCVDGGSVPSQRHVGLAGYPGGSDVAGNLVHQQFQLDTFGELLNLYSCAARLDRMTDRLWRAVEVCVRAIENCWQVPDNGVWELEAETWVHSRLACIAGLKNISQYAQMPLRLRCEELAERILRDIASYGVNQEGAWRQRPGVEETDAAILLPLARGVLPSFDSRTIATINAVQRDLARDGHLYRFRHPGSELGDAEGAFTVCGFMMVLTLIQNRDIPSAVYYYVHAKKSAANSGLFTEEVEVNTHQLRGNLPQAFVHAFFIEATLKLAPYLTPLYAFNEEE